MDQIGQLRAASELLAQRTMERVLDLVVQSLDVNELAQQLDLNAVIENIDLNALLSRVDVNMLLSRVDVQALVERVDVDALVQDTDVGAAVAMSSGHVASKGVDILRGQAVALDERIDGWVRRLLRRRGSGLAAPPTLVNTEART